MCYNKPVSFYKRRLPHWQPEGAALFVTWRLAGSIAATDEHPSTGPYHLQDEKLAGLVATALRYGEKTLNLYRLRAWVIMPNHIHLLIEPSAPIAEITSSIKRFTAARANKLLKLTGTPFWRDEFFDRWMRTKTEADNTVEYIEQNPVRAGLVRTPEDWPWSSAAE